MPTCRCSCSALARPALLERRPAGRATRARFAWCSARSASDESHSLADELLKKLETVPPALRELLTESAEGNPFYMEELIKMLVDEGAIVIDGERWTWSHDKLQRPGAADPDRRAAGAARQPEAGRRSRALQQASVIGLVFWDQALAAIDAHRPGRCPAWPGASWSSAARSAGLDGVREYAFITSCCTR